MSVTAGLAVRHQSLMSFLSDAGHIQPPRSATAGLEGDLIRVQRLSWIVAWLAAACGGVLAVVLAATRGLATGILILTVAAMIPPVAWLAVRQWNAQMLDLALSLGPRLRDAGMKPTKGVFFVFDNGLVLLVDASRYALYATFLLYQGLGGSVLTPTAAELKGWRLPPIVDTFLDCTQADRQLRSRMRAIASDLGGSLNLMGVHEPKSPAPSPAVLPVRQVYAKLSYWSWPKRGAEIGQRLDEVLGVPQTLGA